MTAKLFYNFISGLLEFLGFSQVSEMGEHKPIHRGGQRLDEDMVSNKSDSNRFLD